MEIVIKKGCEIPSYAFWKNPNGEASCYVVDADYIGVYKAEGENKFTITSENCLTALSAKHCIFYGSAILPLCIHPTEAHTRVHSRRIQNCS